MHADRWARIEQLCQEALERSQEQQAAFLDSACGADLELRREVESLLAHRQSAEDFIETPAMHLAARALAAEGDIQSGETSRQIGRRISNYRIVEKVASGGMGDVFRAVRADGTYDKQVAIKLIQGARSTDFFLARFENERQILADLDHPNIARLLDGGTTEEGLPYVVMEYIYGLPIDEYCRQKSLTVRERLELFRTVCSAVQYAHQNLVVHRDLKPSNILVTQEGVPKLLDFGIAKILDPQRGDEKFQQTVTVFRLMTPDYASPEQVRNEPISTASDIYSLGVILYELLTGLSPYRVNKEAPQEMMKAICDTEPEKPSTAAVVGRAPVALDNQQPPLAAPPSLQKTQNQKKLRKVLAGDLDNIVLKALRKEPRRRYSSVEQFSEDIHRYLKGLPVLAHKDTLAYRSRKFVVRHKLGVAVAALFVLSLAGGLFATLWQARIARAERARAERRFNDVRVLANSLMFEIHDSIKDLAGATPARKLLVSKSLQYLDSLSREAAGDASLQQELAAAYEKTGQVQSNPYTANLGDPEGALASYRKALAIRESLAATNPKSDQNQRFVVNDYESIGLTLETLGDYQGALDYYRKAFTIEEPLSKKAPAPESQERLAGAYFLMAHTYAALQDPVHALENYRQSAAIREIIATDSRPLVQSRLAATYSFMAGIVWQQHDSGQATQLQHKTLEIMKTLASASPTNATYREYRDEAYYWLGYFLENDGDFAHALLNYRQALTDLDALVTADPKEVRTKQYVGLCHQSIGTTLVYQGKATEGLQNLREGLSIFEQLPPSNNADNIANSYAGIGLAYSKLAVRPNITASERIAAWKEARAAYQRSLDYWMESKRRGWLTVFSSGEPDRIKQKLAQCNETLANLTAPVP